MRKAIFGGLTLLLVASQAVAGDKVWSVPGVINNGLATVVSCTNGGSASASVTVDVFDQAATLSGTGNANIAAGLSGSFATKAVAILTGETNLAAGDVRGGYAQITAPSGVFCTAYVVDPVNDPPSVAWSLKVVKKTSQKGD